MLCLSCSEDGGCGTDKDLQVSACLTRRSAALQAGGVPASIIKNTTQNGEKCAKKALGPAVTLYNTRGEICTSAFLPLPTVTWKLL